MQQIYINKSADSPVPLAGVGSALQKVTCGLFFETFVESQKQGYLKPDGGFKRKGITIKDAVNLRDETTNILSHSNPHYAVDKAETTHLVVGYVQSGKTLSFTGLVALALDNGYRTIVFLAGTKNNLLKQTSSRLRKDLIESHDGNFNRYKIHENPKVEVMEELIGHIESSDKPIILIPILKHFDHINKLTEIFKTSDFQDVMANETVIIIDDEADQASLNSFGRKNSKKAINEEQEESRTYESILKLRSALPGNTYIQYTATPQANILISMQDLLSPKSHTLLTPGEGYIGGKLFFGREGQNHDLFNGGLIKEIPADQVFHKKRNPLNRMPQSLKDALMLHIMAVAIVVKFLKVEDINFLSMMVHPDNTKKWNKKFKEWIEKELRNWRLALRKPSGQDDREGILERFRLLFPLAIQYYSDVERPTFNQIEKYITDIINDRKVWLVNTDRDAQTDIQWGNYKMHILIGAEMLNRGFTVEKLATTYMPRYSLGLNNADTIQQRCRFFGYKHDFIRSCRVFLPSWSITDYIDYINHEEELRSTLASCDTLAAAERKILLSPNLRPTKQNVLPVSVVKTKLKGLYGLQAFESKSLIEENTKLVQNFLLKHESSFDIKYDFNTLDRTHRGFKLSIDDAITFLSDFRFGNFLDARRKADTIRYIRYLSSEDNVQPLSFIYFIQIAYSAPIRHRAFDFDNLRLSKETSIFAGPSSEGDSTNYPGDRKIVGDDSITVQLFHFYLEGAPLNFAREAYTLAINYPDIFAANYCSNEEKLQLDELDEDE
jgi:hypothetical protein